MVRLKLFLQWTMALIMTHNIKIGFICQYVFIGNGG